MHPDNMEQLENLSLYCQICGFAIVLIGLFIIATSIMNRFYSRIQTGIFLVATGYAQVKISQKLVHIVQNEKFRARQNETR